MKILKKFEDPALVTALAARITEQARQREHYTFMEVCGTHTQAIGRWGLRSFLPDNLRLVSGPGCPVCVTPGDYIDNACDLALNRNVVIATFGDLVRVPGLRMSLEVAQSEGARIEVVYSPMEAVKLAQKDDCEVVFLAVGFETTIAPIAATILATATQKIPNLSFYLSIRAVPPALAALIADPDIRLDGFLLPGHVSTIIGTNGYSLLPAAGIPGAIAGFEPVEILQAVDTLVDCVNSDSGEVVNLYPQVVKQEGNSAALALFEKLLEADDINWRGIGVIPGSGYRLRDEYSHLDTATRFSLPPLKSDNTAGCQCGEVLRGIIFPDECKLFDNGCTPNHPVGPCMVSGEGSCAAYYRYQR